MVLHVVLKAAVNDPPDFNCWETSEIVRKFGLQLGNTHFFAFLNIGNSDY